MIRKWPIFSWKIMQTSRFKTVTCKHLFILRVSKATLKSLRCYSTLATKQKKALINITKHPWITPKSMTGKISLNLQGTQRIYSTTLTSSSRWRKQIRMWTEGSQDQLPFVITICRHQISKGLLSSVKVAMLLSSLSKEETMIIQASESSMLWKEWKSVHLVEVLQG